MSCKNYLAMKDTKLFLFTEENEYVNFQKFKK